MEMAGMKSLLSIIPYLLICFPVDHGHEREHFLLPKQSLGHCTQQKSCLFIVCEEIRCGDKFDHGT